jgi:hypothetical protein
MRNILKRKQEEEEKMTVNVPGFGEFSLEEQPGGTLKGRHSIGGEKFDEVCISYEKRPSPAIHLRLSRFADSGGISHPDSIRVTFKFDEEAEKWKFDKKEGIIGKRIKPEEWENMLEEFFKNKDARKWLKDEETFGPPKKSFFQRHRLG